MEHVRDPSDEMRRHSAGRSAHCALHTAQRYHGTRRREILSLRGGERSASYRLFGNGRCGGVAPAHRALGLA